MAEDRQEREGLKSTGRLQTSLENVRGSWGKTKPLGSGAQEEGTQKIATEQSIEEDTELGEKFSPKGSPGERFRRLTQTVTPPAPPTSSLERKAEGGPLKSTIETGKTLSERRAQEIDPDRLAKSISEPTWPKEKAQEETPTGQSDAKTLRRILKAQEGVEKVKQGPSPEEIKRRIEKRRHKTPPGEHIPSSQMPRQVRPQSTPLKNEEQTTPPPTQAMPKKESFLTKFLNKIFGKR
ncbi:MAG: hypothetical protein WBD86_01990 [Microgenomates group bacterium]